MGFPPEGVGSAAMGLVSAITSHEPMISRFDRNQGLDCAIFVASGFWDY